MNRNKLPEANESELNLMYDLAEGHNVTLKGSMNQATPPEGLLEEVFLSLMQEMAESNDPEAALVQQQLDTNVMYDPISGEGLVCVNGRCISNKRKFQVHDEKHMGLKGGQRRKQGP